ncbi:ABC transporter [Hirsutella rhossiliensis]|uniref:ABC transporter domain-containing protein n=1 Tax=Hirsutella rhossiliensis TaxID=111463 RepID=A0A9P8MVD5_9HYPO|nr:ABC transporter domain-containing protein [Hirsutella rhossiliensis]KAH0962803.1 ABC transporter domain-containing protein [Hirsutella rhossiliensis]
MPYSTPASEQDLEKGCEGNGYLFNSSVKDITWKGVTVTVEDKTTTTNRTIVDDVCGTVKAGEICAIVGPSGCGKTTLLSVLADKPIKAKKIESEILVNSSFVSRSDFKRASCFVEHEDAFIGSLTARESVEFASRLACSASLPRHVRDNRIDSLLHSFGLTEQANTLIGTSLRHGISVGEKRRVSVVSQLITCPKILFLDEPTSGLDSAASYKVVSYLKSVAKQNNLIVIISIHQPSAKTFGLFDKLMLLTGGKMHYFGSMDGFVPYYESTGIQIQSNVNPSEHLLDLVNIDFAEDRAAAEKRLGELHEAWERSPQYKEVCSALPVTGTSTSGNIKLKFVDKRPSKWSLTLTLLHRNFIKSHRDVMAYGTRLVLFAVIALLSGTVWLRLDSGQSSIQSYIIALFAGTTLVPFISIAYTPAFLEDHHQYTKERGSGLYGPTEFIIANSLIGIPALFATNSGFMVPPTMINRFYKNAVYHLNHQKYVFQGLMANEFKDRCKIAGQAVLDYYDISGKRSLARNVGITIAIIFVYRLLAWSVLKMRR